MIIIGLTGSIAMGKSTVAKQFSRFGAAVCDSDKIVHQLLGARGQAVKPVSALFPSALEGQHINRKILAQEVFGNTQKLTQLEAILHPLVKAHQKRLITQARLQKRRWVILDIPLLFETHAQTRCDYTVLVSAPAFLQRQRALKRAHMTPEKLQHILARQMHDSQKRKHADFIILTGLGKYHSLKMVQRTLHTILLQVRVKRIFT